jgi:hypothetical protein
LHSILQSLVNDIGETCSFTILTATKPSASTGWNRQAAAPPASCRVQNSAALHGQRQLFPRFDPACAVEAPDRERAAEALYTKLDR